MKPSFHRLSPHKLSQESAIMLSAAVEGPWSLTSVCGTGARGRRTFLLKDVVKSGAASGSFSAKREQQQRKTKVLQYCWDGSIQCRYFRDEREMCKHEISGGYGCVGSSK